MRIAIRKETNGIIYIDKNLKNNIPYTEPPYNFKIIDVEKEDCESSDFDDDLTFNIQKYNTRKQNKIDEIEIKQLKQELESLSKDFIQVLCGAIIPDFEQRRQLFISKHNYLRWLENKQPRQYK